MVNIKFSRIIIVSFTHLEEELSIIRAGAEGGNSMQKC